MCDDHSATWHFYLNMKLHGFDIFGAVMLIINITEFYHYIVAAKAMRIMSDCFMFIIFHEACMQVFLFLIELKNIFPFVSKPHCICMLGAKDANTL